MGSKAPYDGTKEGSACIGWRIKTAWRDSDFKLQTPPEKKRNKLVRATHAWWKKEALGSAPPLELPQEQRIRRFYQTKKVQARAIKKVRFGQFWKGTQSHIAIRREKPTDPLWPAFKLFWNNLPRPLRRIPNRHKPFRVYYWGSTLTKCRTFFKSIEKLQQMKRQTKPQNEPSVRYRLARFATFWNTIEMPIRLEQARQERERWQADLDSKIKAGILRAIERIRSAPTVDEWPEYINSKKKAQKIIRYIVWYDERGDTTKQIQQGIRMVYGVEVPQEAIIGCLIDFHRFQVQTIQFTTPILATPPTEAQGR